MTAVVSNPLSAGTAGLADNASGSAPRTGLAQRLGLPPADVLRAYAIGWVPLFVVYTIAFENSGDFSREFHLLRALFGALRGIGPAVLLLILVWPYTGWIERRGFGVARMLANHIGMAAVFAATWHGGIYLLFWATLGRAEAERAWDNWFLWQSMWGMMLYWAVAGGFSAYRAVQRARAEAAASAQAQALLARTELAALRNKLNPHFLFNTLHSILALVRKDALRAEGALLMFSDMLRYVLDTEKAGIDHVPLQQEIDFTRAYLELEALRLGDRLTVEWQLEEQALGLPVPALSVQPLVENSIRHAFNPRSAPGRLRIAVGVDHAAGLLRVDVEDDGPGCTEEALAEARGLGLKTVARRLALESGGRSGLGIDTRPGAGFKVRMSLPVAAR